MRVLWPWRAVLERRTVFKKQIKATGRRWWEHLEHYADKLHTPEAIAFAFISTHNHFALERGGKVFNRTAPVIKLKDGATEDDHLALLAYVNSSTAGFWLHQVCQPKTMGNASGANATPFLVRREHNAADLQKLPVPEAHTDEGAATVMLATRLARELDSLARELRPNAIASLFAQNFVSAAEFRDAWMALLRHRKALRAKAIQKQELLDWAIYELFELVPYGFAARWSKGLFGRIGAAWGDDACMMQRAVHAAS